jgi:hypothetical protein
MAADVRERQKEMTSLYGMASAKGDTMKKTLAVLVLCGFSQGAHAKEPACRDIQSSSARLACYDLASPPKPEQHTVTESNASRPAYEDPFIAEDAKTTAKLKNICRGC